MNNMKNVLFVLLVVGIVFMMGCSSPDVVEEVSDNIEEIPEETNDVSESSVVRSFSASTVSVGSNLVVTLTKTLDASQTSLLVEENVPVGWTIVDADTGTVAGNTIRWAELTGAASGTYTYIVTAADSEAWTGQYAINGQEPVDIGGLTTIEII